MGTKNNPGQYDCYSKAEPDEPMFVLLARDPVAPILIRIWAILAGFMEGKSAAKLAEAEWCAKEMTKWKEDHPDH